MKEQVLEQIKATLHEDDYEVSCYEALVGGEEVMITLHDLEVDYETEEWLERFFSDFEAILELIQWLTDSCLEKIFYGDFPVFRFDGFSVLVVDEWTV